MAVSAGVSLQAMRESAASLQAIQAQLPDAEDVADEQFEINQILEQVNEFNQVLSAGFDVNSVNEAEMDAELAGLDAELGFIPTAPPVWPPQQMAQPPYGGQLAQPPYGGQLAQPQPPFGQQAAWGGGGGGGGVPSAPLQGPPGIQLPPGPQGPYATGVSSVAKI